MDTLILLALILLVLGLAGALAWSLRRRPKPAPDVHGSLLHMRSIGQLSVFKVLTKEVVTETDHSWGEFGVRYLSHIMSSRKMAMIFEFEIDFRYDLRRPEFEIVPTGDDTFCIHLPPCFHEAHIRDIRFYDEQRSRLLPWLLPDLLNSFLGGGFSEEDKNRLVASARAHAEQQALQLIDDLASELQNSARATRQSIARAFGADRVEFEFNRPSQVELNVDVAPRAA